MHPRMIHTPETLAERWACSSQTIRSMIERGDLPAFRAGRLWRIRVEDVEAWETKKVETKAEPDISKMITRNLRITRMARNISAP